MMHQQLETVHNRKPATVVALLLLAALVLLPASRAGADTQSFYFTSYHADYALDKTPTGHAVATVTETLVAQFPDYAQNHGIIRVLPLTYDTLDTPIQVTSITDAQGAPYQYTTDTSSGNLELKIGDPSTYLTGLRTFVLHYTVTDPVHYFPNTKTTEFYWNTNGTQWQQQFQKVSATITVSPTLAQDLTNQQACYYGPAGANNSCTITRDGSLFNASAPRQLAAGENMTVAVGFQNGSFVLPKLPLYKSVLISITHALANMSFFIVYLVALIASLIAGAAYKQRTRYRTQTVVAEYDPPAETDLYAVANVLEELGEKQLDSMDKQAFTASLLRMAVNHNITIQPVVPNSNKFVFTINNRDGLSEPENQILDAFVTHMPNRATYPLDSQDVALARALRNIGAGNGVSRGYLVRGAKPHWGFRLARMILVVVGIVAAASVPVYLLVIQQPLDAPFGGIPFLIGFGALAVLFPKYIARVNKVSLTPEGKQLADHMNGLREYIRVAERDRIKFLQSVTGAERSTGKDGQESIVLFERLLPYATLLGLERSWGETLAEVYKQYNYTPTWYPYGYSPYMFTHSVYNSAGSTYSYTPPSSGGSGGSGGGGFSGGGGGGGGGGGW